MLLKLCMHTSVHLHLPFHMEKKEFYVNFLKLFLLGNNHMKLDFQTIILWKRKKNVTENIFNLQSRD